MLAVVHDDGTVQRECSTANALAFEAGAPHAGADPLGVFPQLVANWLRKTRIVEDPRLALRQQFQAPVPP